MGYKKNKKCEDIYLVQSDILRKQTHNSWRAAHVSFSPKLNQWNRRGGGKATIYALVVFSNSENPAPNVFSRGERCGGGGGLKDRAGRYKEALCLCCGSVTKDNEH